MLLIHRCANRRAPRRVAAITIRQSRDDHCTRKPRLARPGLFVSCICFLRPPRLFRFAGACLRAARYASPDGLSCTPGLHPTAAGDVASVAFLDTGRVLLSVRGRDRGKGRHEARGYESNSNFHNPPYVAYVGLRQEVRESIKERPSINPPIFNGPQGCDEY